MQWRKWQKIASLWQFELDATRGPLETCHFGEIGDFGENHQRAGVNGEKRPGPFETGDLGENSHFGENRHRAGDNRKTSRRKSPGGLWYPECGKYLNWMPKVAHIKITAQDVRKRNKYHNKYTKKEKMLKKIETDGNCGFCEPVSLPVF